MFAIPSIGCVPPVCVSEPLSVWVRLVLEALEKSIRFKSLEKKTKWVHWLTLLQKKKQYYTGLASVDRVDFITFKD